MEIKEMSLADLKIAYSFISAEDTTFKLSIGLRNFANSEQLKTINYNNYRLQLIADEMRKRVDDIVV